MALVRPVILLAMLTAFAASKSDVVGTWTGESLCVGNRPACQNEVVVYRFGRLSV